jgi:hypothetical protein
MTKYNEFYGGVRCYTFISQRAERAHIQGTPQAAGSREARLTGRKLQQLVHIYPLQRTKGWRRGGFMNVEEM